MALRNNSNNNNNKNLLREVKILQHNVQHWLKERLIELGNYYRKENPEIILLNSTGVNDRNTIKIFNYNVTSRNPLNEAHAGVAVAVRRYLQNRIVDDFADDILGVQLETTRGHIMIITNYSPPRRNYMPTAEIENKMQKNIPVYFVGDLNAHLPAMGYRNYNTNRREIKRLFQQNKIIHMGPDFRTMVRMNGRPDIIFSSQNAFLKYAVERGSLTTSDHFPVILKLSTRPIVKRAEQTRCLRKTNWETFKDRMEERMDQTFNLTELENRPDINANVLEDLYRSWYEAIESSLEETSPKTRLSYYLHTRESNYLKLLEITYQDMTNKPYWTRDDIEVLKNLQQ